MPPLKDDWVESIPVCYDNELGACYAAETKGPPLFTRPKTPDSTGRLSIVMEIEDTYKIAMKSMGIKPPVEDDCRLRLTLGVRDARYMAVHLLQALADTGCPVSMRFREMLFNAVDEVKELENKQDENS